MQMDIPPIDEGVVAAAQRLLVAHQPIALTDLVDLLAQEGVAVPKDEDPLRWVLRHLNMLQGTWELPDVVRGADLDAPADNHRDRHRHHRDGA
jgi:hypothetical protein